MIGKFTFFIAFVLIGISLSAQPVVTLPFLGDQTNEYTFKTAAAGDLNIDVDGPGATWDFSQIHPDSILPGVSVQQYIEVSTAPFINLFGSADFVLRNTENGTIDYTYLELAANRVQVIGTYSQGDTIPVVFPQPILLSPLPLEFGFSESETVPFLFDFLEGVDTFQLTNSYDADGYGTLLLPGGFELENTMRLKATSVIDGLVETEEFGTVRILVDQTSYLFLHNDFGTPVSTYTRQSITFFLVVGPIQVPIFEFPTQLTLEYFNANSTSVNELTKNIDVEIYPNPTADIVHVNISEIPSVEAINWIICDIAGKVILRGEFNSGESTINLAGLNSGIYQLLIKTEDGMKSLPIVKK